MVLQSGFIKPVTRLNMTDKEQITRTVILHSVILSSLAGLTQFRDGIWTIEGMKEALKNHSGLLEPFFCNKEIPLTAGMCIHTYVHVNVS